MLRTLDQVDLRILDLLQHNARIGNKEIALSIGMSTSRVFERVKRLNNQGFIRQYVAVLDHKLIGNALLVYAFIRLKEHSKNLLLRFENEISLLEEVMECYHMSGQCDFLLKVVVSDIDGYNNFVVNQLASFNEIKTVSSLFVMKELKVENTYPL